MHKFAPLFWASLTILAVFADRGPDDIRFCMAMSVLAGIASLLTDIRDRL